MKKKGSMQGLPSDFRDRLMLLKLLKRCSLFFCVVSFLMGLLSHSPYCFGLGLAAHLLYGAWFFLAVPTYRRYGNHEYRMQALENHAGICMDTPALSLIFLSWIEAYSFFRGDWNAAGYLYLAAGVVAVGLMVWGDHALSATLCKRKGLKRFGILAVGFILSCTMMAEVNLFFARKTGVYSAKIVYMGGHFGPKGSKSYGMSVEFEGKKKGWQLTNAEMSMLAVGDEIQVEEYTGPLWMQWYIPVLDSAE